jgi:hypothetical protein
MHRETGVKESSATCIDGVSKSNTITFEFLDNTLNERLWIELGVNNRFKDTLDEFLTISVIGFTFTRTKY